MSNQVKYKVKPDYLTVRLSLAHYFYYCCIILKTQESAQAIYELGTIFARGGDNLPAHLTSSFERDQKYRVFFGNLTVRDIVPLYRIVKCRPSCSIVW
jgi:hypothetical protein